MDYDLFGNPIPSPQETEKIAQVPRTTTTFQQWQIREGNLLYHAGARQIPTTHLLAHLLRNQETAQRLMDRFGDLSAIADASLEELMQVKGIGQAKAETIQVAFELSRRLTNATHERKPAVCNPKDIYLLLKEDFRGLKQEQLKVLLLDTKNHVERIETVFVGTLNASITHPREIFHAAIKHSAASIILSHNHPSGVRL